MYLWKIERQDQGGCDTYDSAVVAAEYELDARTTSPTGWEIWVEGTGWVRASNGLRDSVCGYSWTSPNFVTVTKIGTATEGTERGVIVASFNAG